MTSAATRLTTLKLAFVAAGMLAFGVGIRFDVAAVRWAGIGLVAVAFVLRFAGRGVPADGGQRLDDETR